MGARGGRSWLRQCATIREVAGSTPDGVIQLKPSDTASNRNEYQGYLLKSKGGWPMRRADNLATFMCRLSRNFESLSRPVTG
jgi:hypothetical protein